MIKQEIDWEDFFQAINHPVLILDAEHHILAANTAAEKYMGSSLDKIVGRHCYELIHNHDSKKPPFCCPLETLVKEGKVEAVEMEMETFGGYALVSCTPVLDEKGNLDKIIHIATDITRRKNSEEALKKSEHSISGLISNLPGMVYRCQNDKNWTMEYISQQCKDLTGYEPSDFINNNTLAYGDIIHPEDQEQVWNNVQKAISMDKAFQINYRILTRDEKIKWVWERGFGTRDDEGELFLEGFIEDITSRKKVEDTLKSSEEALKESERNYRELVDNSLVGIFKTNLEGEILFANAAMAKMFHYDSADELKENNIIRVYESDEERLKFLRELKKRGKLTDYEVRAVDKDGQKVNVLVSASLEDNVLSGMFMDITDRKRSELKLKESEGRIAAIFNTVKSGIIMVDKEGFIDFANQHMTEMFGYKLSELIGMSYLNLTSDKVINEAEKSMLTLIRGEIDHVLLERLYQHKDGSTFWGQISANRLLNVDGSFKGLIGVITDISDGKKAEEKLKESEEKYRTVIDTAGEAIILYDNKGNVIEANQKALQLFGFKKEELVGKNLINLLPKLNINIKEALSSFKDVIIGKDISQTDWTFTNVSGEEKTVVAHYTRLKKGKKTMGITLLLEDITERKKAENRIMESLEEKEVLLREIHHRVKNNMQIISSLLNLQIQFEDLDETVGVLKESQGRVKSMAMVHEKLYRSDCFSKINFKEYLTNLVSDILYSYNIQKEKIDLKLDIEDVNVGIDTAIPLGLIINELVTNSVKYAFPEDKKGTIWINFKLEDHFHVLIISDNGVGIPEDIEPGKTESLGLQLVMSLVNQLDGTIKLDRNRGTRYTIKFQELKYKKRI